MDTPILLKLSLIQPHLAFTLEQAEYLLFHLEQIVASLDPDTRAHSIRLAQQCKAFGQFLGLSQRDLQILVWGGYLHDIGKLAIPLPILQKPGQLTPYEWQWMQWHSPMGAEICRSHWVNQQVIAIVRHHHERWDGSGYPNSLAGNEIPYLAQVVQILDVFDALTHERCYKPAFSFSQAVRTLAAETARGWYQPTLMEQFFDFLAEEPCFSNDGYWNEAIA